MSDIVDKTVEGNIRVTGDTSQARTVIKNLTHDVEELKVAVAGIDSVAPHLVALSNALAKLGPTSNNIGRLVTSLTRLDRAFANVTSLSDADFAKFGTGLGKLTNAMKPLNDFKTTTLGTFLNSLNSLSDTIVNLSLADMDTFSSQLGKLATAIHQFDNIKDNGIGSTLNGLTKITRISAGINDVGGVEAFAEKMGGVATAIKPLTELGKTSLGSTFNQLKKIPEITASLNVDVMREFKNVILELTAIMTPLAEKCNQVSSAFGRLPRNIQSASGAFVKLKQAQSASGGGLGLFSGKMGNLTRFIGQFWMIRQAVNMVTNGFKNLFNASSDYIEALNLFNVAMGDCARSAEAFADTVHEALGIDKKEWMEFQGGLNMLITGFDVASDKAQIMSQNLTQLAYDYSSLMNVDPSEAFQKIQSAMSGQVKGLKAYGNNVSVAMMKQVGLRYGLRGSVSDWDNATQATIRYITIMENASKTGVFNDLARTINTPANAMRIFSAQCSVMVRSIGNIASAILSKAIPYLQLLAQVVARVANFIAKLLGFKMPKIDYKGISYGSKAMKDASNNAGKLGKNTGGAGKSAKKAGKEFKKLKDITQSWDELHLIQKDPSNSSGAGGGGGVGGGGGGLGGGSGLQSLGDIDLPTYDFLKGLEDQANERIDKLMAKLNEFFTPVVGAWNTKGKPMMDSITNMFHNIGYLINGIADSWYTVWQNGTGQKTVELMFQIITNVSDIVGGLAKKFGDAWVSFGLGTSIVQSVWNSFNNILSIVEKITRFIAEVAKSFDWTPVLKMALGVLQVIEGVLAFIDEHVGVVVGALAGLSIAPQISALVSMIASSGIAGTFETLVASFLSMTSVGGTLSGIMTSLSGAFATLTAPVTLVVAGIGALVGILAEAYTKSEIFRNKINNAIANVASTLSAFVSANIQPAIALVTNLLRSFWESGGKYLFEKIKEFIVVLTAQLANFINFISPFAKKALNFIKSILIPVFGGLGTIIGSTLGVVATILGGVIDVLNALLSGKAFKNPKATFSKIGKNVVSGLAKGFGNIGKVILAPFKKAWNAIKKFFGVGSGKSKEGKNIGSAILGGIKTGLATIGDILLKPFKDAWDAIKKVFANPKDLVKGVGDKIGSALGSVKDFITAPFTDAYKSVKKSWSNPSSMFSGVTDKIKKLADNAGTSIREAMGVYTIDLNTSIPDSSEVLRKLKASFGGVKTWFAENVSFPTLDLEALNLPSGKEVLDMFASAFGGVTPWLNTNIVLPSFDIGELNMPSASAVTSALVKSFGGVTAWFASNITMPEFTIKKPWGEGTSYSNMFDWLGGKVAGVVTATLEVELPWGTSFAKWMLSKISSVTTSLGVTLPWGDSGFANWIKGKLSSVAMTFTASLPWSGSSFVSWLKGKMSSVAISFSSNLPWSGTFSSWLKGKMSTVGITFGIGSLPSAKSIAKKIGTVTITITNKLTSTFKGFLKKIGKAFSFSFFATGGYPATGSLFVAREAGPELVGTIGSRTAVVNNDQIVASVANGVARALTNVLSSIKINGAGGGQVIENVVNLDGRTIYQNQQEVKKRQGYDFGFNY